MAITSAILLGFVCRSLADIAPFYGSEAYAAGLYGNYTRQRYLSDDSLEGPVANILVPPQEGLSPSKYVGWAPGGPREYLPLTHAMLLDAHTFATVWNGPALGSQTIGPTVQTCNDTQYLTWWSGEEYDGHKQGAFYMANNRYEIVHNISGIGAVRSADVHEMYLTPNCTAVITGYENESWDLSYYNFTNGFILDSYFQEIDVATGKLLFEWKASKHIPDIIAETEGREPINEQGGSFGNAHDWMHINSVEKDHRGNYLISARHCYTIYYISGVTGEVIWRLGGAASDFKDLSGGRATDFSWQHHARWLNHDLTRMSLFDDHSGGDRFTPTKTRAIVLQLDYETMEVKLEHEYMATNEIVSTREGSAQVLTDSPTPGNMLVGYGEEPAWTEYHQNGTVLLDVTFGPLWLNRESADNYRTLKVNWTGLPWWAPKIAPGPPKSYTFSPTTGAFHIPVSPATANDTAYFSWNGATEITSWAVLASNSTTNLTVQDHFLTEIPKSGFESHAFVGPETRFVTALALDANDAVLGATPVIAMQGRHTYVSPAGPAGNDTQLLTCAWRAFVVSHLASSAFARAHTPLHAVRQGMYRASLARRVLPVLACLVALGVVGWAAAVTGWGARVRRLVRLRMVRGGYLPVAEGEEEYWLGERGYSDKEDLLGRGGRE